MLLASNLPWFGSDFSYDSLQGSQGHTVKIQRLVMNPFCLVDVMPVIVYVYNPVKTLYSFALKGFLCFKCKTMSIFLPR